MIQQAAKDVLSARESVALDGAEFLGSTGVWLCEELFGKTPTETRRELIRLLKQSRSLRERTRDAIAAQV